MISTCRKVLVRLSKNVFFQIWNTDKVIKCVLSGETLTLLQATNTCAYVEQPALPYASRCLERLITYM